VSCTSAKDCTAVGAALLDSPPYYVAFYETESAGTWGPVTGIGFHGQESGPLSSVSCTSAANCTAFGGDGNYPLYATEADGTWGTATDDPAPGASWFDGISCTSATDCTGVGGGDHGQPLYATETDGV
jgi:hypothetical protein